jgi:glycosyltransferase involved in cell wall biosynthesis
MRTLVINSMFVNAMYRRCADELGAMPGIDLSIFLPRAWRMNDKVLPLDPLMVGSPYRMMTGRTGWKGFENRGFYTSGLIRAFKQSKPEVLFLMEEPFSVFAAEVMMVKKMLGYQIPTVFFTWTNLSFFEFDYRPSFFYRAIAQWTLPGFDRALTANRDGIRVLREAGFQKPATTVGYGVDTDKYASVDVLKSAALRAQLSLAPEDRVIGYVGRIKRMKGLDLLIDAFAALLREGEQHLKLLFVGSGEDEAEFLSLVRSRGVESNFRHVRTVPQYDVPAYMHVIDTLVLPSRRVAMWAEQFGRVLVEGMTSGCVVLGSTSGAIPEVIGDAGFTFEENNTVDLQLKLREILSLSTTDRSDLVARARSRAQDQYSWPSFARRAEKELWAAREDWQRRTP